MYDAQSVPTRDAIYYWRVRACSSIQCGKWSRWQSFTVLPQTGWTGDAGRFATLSSTAQRTERS